MKIEKEHIIVDTTDEYFEDIEWDDEKMNLNKEIAGVIVALVDVGRWNGRFVGTSVFTSNINSILNVFSCDDGKFYVEGNAVKSELYHHDGTHYLTYRIAPNKDVAEKIMDRANNGTLTEDYFTRVTKPLAKHIKDIYGW